MNSTADDLSQVNQINISQVTSRQDDQEVKINKDGNESIES